MKYARVHRWLGKDNTRVYQFGRDIPLYIFEDDTIERMVNKIAAGIHHFHTSNGETALAPSLLVKPYVWTPKRGSLRFGWRTEKGDEASPNARNPWEARTGDVPATVRVVYHEQAFVEETVTDIHVVFSSDLPEALASPWFFPDAATPWKAPSFETLVAEDKLIVSAWEFGEGTSTSIVVTKATFETKLPTSPDLVDLFGRISTSKQIPFLQLVEDEHKVLYKVHKKHTMTLDQLQLWTSWERVPKVGSLVLMIATNIKAVFARFVLDREGGIHLSYHMESRENVHVDAILQHKQMVEAWTARYLGKVKLEPTLTSAKVEVPAQNISLPTLSKHLSKYASLFHVHRVLDGTLEASCKRSKNFKQKLDIADYIASRIHVGTPVPEIMTDLMDLGLSREDVAFWLAQYQTNTEAEAPKKKTLSSTGCALRISKFATGFRVYIEQAASFVEVERIYRWIYGSIMALRVPVRATEQVVQAAPQRVSRSASQSESLSASPENNVLNDDSFELSGGALGKTYQRYFSTELKKADPEIFKDAKKYSRQCGATSLRQPVVISAKEKEALDKSPYASSFDDAVMYGSDQHHQNYYMCPRIWCPISRIPLTEEQLQANQGKCPGPHFEEPIILYQDKYWGKSAQKPHYVGFMDNRSPKGFCLPCCFTSKIKENTAKQCGIPNGDAPAAPGDEGVGPSVATAADETYIMGAPPPIDKNRFGSIPKSMHHVFMPAVAYATCSKTISTSACYVRRGVGIEDDSFMRSLAIALDLESKAGLMQYIQKRLDPLTFLSLENCHVLQAFAETEAIMPHTKETKELRKEWKKWIVQQKAYVKAMHLDVDRIDGYALSRELGIYKAYRNFLQHLRSSDPKNPQHLIDFFLRQGILLVLWKRQGNQASMLCPYFRDVAALLKAHGTMEHAIMLLQDGEYFEPIELKKRSTKGIALHPLESIPNVVGLQSSCPAPIFDDTSMDILRKLQVLSAWSSLAMQNPQQFRFRRVILRPDMTIYGIMTYANVLILTPRSCPIAILPQLLREFEIHEVVHQEDVAGRITYSIQNVLITDIQSFMGKLQEFGFGFHLGTPLSGGSSYILEAKITIPEVAPTILPVVKTNAPNAMTESWKRQDKAATKWRQWQLLVGKTLFTYYDTLVAPVLSYPRAKQIRVLLQTFPGIIQNESRRAKLQQVFEEMPFAEGKDALARWLRSIQYHRTYLPYTNASVQYGSKEVLFSQAAVDHGIPWQKLLPTAAPTAQDAQNPSQSLVVVPRAENEGNKPPRLPCMLQKSMVTESGLPTKFRGYSFAKYKIWKRKEACGPRALPEMVLWLAGQRAASGVTLDDISYIKTITISKLLKDEESATVLGDDPSYLLAWGQVMKKKFKKPSELWSRLKDLTYENRRAIWLENVATNSLLKWNDLDWYVLSQLVDVNVFMIHRAKHGGTEQVREYARGNIEDLSLSSYFLTGAGADWKSLPCIFLYKEYADTHCDYHVIVDEAETVLHPITKKLPKDVLELMELHVARRG